MIEINNDRYRNLLSVLFVSKLVTLFYLFSNNISIMFKWKDITNYWGVSTNVLYISVITLFTGISLWSWIYEYMYKTRRMVIAIIIEELVYISLLTLLQVYSLNSNINTHFLYIFSIVTVSITFGKIPGISSAIFISFMLFLIDLKGIEMKGLPVNVYFQSDTILALAFITVAFSLGEYKKFERDQRVLLEKELDEQLLKYNQIDYMLLKNEDSFNLLVEKSDYSIIVHSETDILYTNKKTMELLGCETYSQVKEEFFSNLRDIYKKENVSNLYDIVNTKSSNNVEYIKNITTSGNTNITVHSMSASFTYGKIPAIITILKDISSEVKVKQLKADVEENARLLNESQEYNKHIIEFFSNISHELKTPLNIIFSSVHMLGLYNDNKDDSIIDKRKDYLQIVKQNSYRLIRLINNILDISKYDSGFMTLNLKNRDIVCMVEDITLSVVPYAESMDIEIIFDTEIEEKIIAFDGDKIERIILNLLSNALKFTNQGGKIFVNIVDEGEMIGISIKDTGIGIPEDKIPFIFDRFVQVDKTFNRNREGTGIGLSLVKSFVKIHGGEVGLKSKLGEGSEFFISFPYKLVKEESIEEEIKNSIINRVNMELSDIYSDTIN